MTSTEYPRITRIGTAAPTEEDKQLLTLSAALMTTTGSLLLLLLMVGRKSSSVAFVEAFSSAGGKMLTYHGLVCDLSLSEKCFLVD
jgi:hypothetical protein